MTTTAQFKIDRVKLHAFIDSQVDIVEATGIPDDMDDLTLATDVIREAGGNPLDPMRLWRVAGLATLVGLAVYEDAERFVTPAADPVAAGDRAMVADMERDGLL